MENSKSSYVKIINEICAEEGIKLSSYSYDWAFCLKGSKACLHFGVSVWIKSFVCAAGMQ